MHFLSVVYCLLLKASAHAEEWKKTNSSRLVPIHRDGNFVQSFGYPLEGRDKVTKYHSKIGFLDFFNLLIS